VKRDTRSCKWHVVHWLLATGAVHYAWETINYAEPRLVGRNSVGTDPVDEQAQPTPNHSACKPFGGPVGRVAGRQPPPIIPSNSHRKSLNLSEAGAPLPGLLDTVYTADCVCGVSGTCHPSPCFPESRPTFLPRPETHRKGLTGRVSRKALGPLPTVDTSLLFGCQQWHVHLPPFCQTKTWCQYCHDLESFKSLTRNLCRASITVGIDAAANSTLLHIALRPQLKGRLPASSWAQPLNTNGRTMVQRPTAILRMRESPRA
jgi:hypothetical protein